MNPTIGIILCDSKDETVIKYSVIQESHRSLIKTLIQACARDKIYDQSSRI